MRRKIIIFIIFTIIFPSTILYSAEDTGVVVFQSYSNPNQFIKIGMKNCTVSPIRAELENKQFFFKIGPGLADESNLSIESVARPGHYLVHDGEQVKIEKLSNTSEFKERAGFYNSTSLIRVEGHSLISFAPMNKRNHFIRQIGNKLSIAFNEGTTKMKEESTFRIIAKKNLHKAIEISRGEPRRKQPETPGKKVPIIPAKMLTTITLVILALVLASVNVIFFLYRHKKKKALTNGKEE